MRSSLADAAFAVEERVLWGGANVLRRVFELVRWPFERAAWAIERALIWPVEERTGGWNGPLRAAGMAALALLAVGAGVLGLVWASGSGGGTPQSSRQAVVPVAAPPAAKPAAAEKLAKAAPVLHGATPKFVPETGGAAAQAGSAKAATADGEASAAGAGVSSTSDTPTSSSDAAAAQPAGPAAAKVAHRFSAAFVLYEIGKTDAKVRETFAATATPQLTHSLLRRPPRLPAGAKVPQAKVLNIVPGPKQGDTYTLSVSLLRVGVTSELRLDMQRDEKSHRWQVTDVRG